MKNFGELIENPEELADLIIERFETCPNGGGCDGCRSGLIMTIEEIANYITTKNFIAHQETVKLLVSKMEEEATKDGIGDEFRAILMRSTKTLVDERVSRMQEAHAERVREAQEKRVEAQMTPEEFEAAMEARGE